MADENGSAIIEKPSAEIQLGGQIRGGIVPQNMSELWRCARVLASSNLTPKGLNTPEQVFVALELGLELGMPPMQALRSICVINGSPSLYGDAQLAIVMDSKLLEKFSEEPIENEDGECVGYVCKYWRKGYDDPVRSEFTLKDAKKAGLWGKSGPWSSYPKRMFKMRARSFGLRDLFPDVLGGLYSVEEAQDIPQGEIIDSEYAIAGGSGSGDVASLKERLQEVAEPTQDVADGPEPTLDPPEATEQPEEIPEELDIQDAEFEEVPYTVDPDTGEVFDDKGPIEPPDMQAEAEADPEVQKAAEIFGGKPDAEPEWGRITADLRSDFGKRYTETMKLYIKEFTKAEVKNPKFCAYDVIIETLGKIKVWCVKDLKSSKMRDEFFESLSEALKKRLKMTQDMGGEWF